MSSLLELNSPVGRGQVNDPEDVYAFDKALREIGVYTPPPEYAAEPQRYPTAAMIRVGSLTRTKQEGKLRDQCSKPSRELTDLSASN